jgi:hypothetical protein
MDARTVARLQAVTRAGLGAALLAAPRLTGAAWIGRTGLRPSVRVVIAGLGARDVGLGLGTSWALTQGAGVRPWIAAGALADATDAIATIRHRSHLPTVAVAGITLMAGGSAALGLWLQRELDQPSP